MPAVATLSPTITASITPTFTITATPTATPALTLTPAQDPRTCTATVSASPTPTATASPTPAWQLALDQVLVYPNPARDRVTFAYQATGPVRVEIDLYRLTGERVAQIRESRDAGSGSVQATVWEAGGCAAGIYIARIVVIPGDGSRRVRQLRKVALIR